MRVPWGLEWPLNWLALESGKDDQFQDWNRNHRPSGGVYVGCILTLSSVSSQFSCFGVVVRVPQGLKWPLNWLALESGKDDPF